MKILKNYCYLLFMIVLAASCRIQQKMPVYLQGATNENISRNIRIPELKIQKNDQLAISVYSDFIPKDANPDDLYNQVMPQGGSSSSYSSSQGGSVSTTDPNRGYLVDNNGNIQYPRLGTIHVEGMTKDQLENEIKRRLTSPVELLKNPTVIVRFQTYKIITVGEFNAPQVLNIPTEKVNIFEAVSMAGGITEWGRKDSIKIIREQDGRRELGLVSLASPTVFSSPYYYLKQGDILLVDPIQEKARQSDEAATLRKVGYIMTAASIGTLVLSLVNLLRK